MKAKVIHMPRHARPDSWAARVRAATTRAGARDLVQAYAEHRDTWTTSQRWWWEAEAARVLQEVAGDE